MRYWFPAKRFGWGWGLPVRWQGWAVLGAFALLVGVGAWIFLRNDERFSFIGYVAGLTVLLLIVCYVTGEPPSWRSGDKR